MRLDRAQESKDGCGFCSLIHADWDGAWDTADTWETPGGRVREKPDRTGGKWEEEARPYSGAAFAVFL